MRAYRAARAVTCIALASALCVPAVAAQFDYYLKLEGVDGESTAAKHKGEIEILSYSWGPTQSAAGYELEPVRVTSWSTSGAGDTTGAHGAGGGGGAGKVSVHDISLAPAPEAGKTSKVEAINIKQTTTAASDGEAEITLKGQAAEAKKRPGRTKYGDITLKRGVIGESEAKPGGVSVAAGDVDGDGRAEAKHKSGSLVYLNRNRQKELGKPAPSGSVTLLVPTGHGLCTAGKPLGTLTLGGSGMRPYVLKGVTVAGCAAAEGGDRPMESLSLNYTKIEF